MNNETESMQHVKQYIKDREQELTKEAQVVADQPMRAYAVTIQLEELRLLSQVVGDI